MTQQTSTSQSSKGRRTIEIVGAVAAALTVIAPTAAYASGCGCGGSGSCTCGANCTCTNCGN